MKLFKFLRRGNYKFAFEFILNLDVRNSSGDSYNTRRSEIIKEWLSVYYFERPLGSVYKEYLPEVDRVCEILECGVVNCSTINCFDVKVKISKSDFDFIIIDLRYPLDDIVEYERV